MFKILLFFCAYVKSGDIKLYEHVNFQGAVYEFDLGMSSGAIQRCHDFVSRWANDQISSAKWPCKDCSTV
jgi:hypothetical protein